MAEFIGETNLLTGSCLGMDGNEVVIDRQGLQIRARAGGVQPVTGSEVICSMRLEKLHCQANQPATQATVAAHITGKVFMESRTAVIANIDAAPDIQLRAFVDAEQAIGDPGDAVQFGWNSANLALLRQ